MRPFHTLPYARRWQLSHVPLWRNGRWHYVHEYDARNYIGSIGESNYRPPDITQEDERILRALRDRKWHEDLLADRAERRRVANLSRAERNREQALERLRFTQRVRAITNREEALERRRVAQQTRARINRNRAIALRRRAQR